MNTKLRMRLVFTVTFIVALAATVAAMALTAHYTEYKAETTATYESELSALAAANGGVKQVASGMIHTVILFGNGTVYATGSDDMSQFGFFTEERIYKSFVKLSLTNVTSIACGPFVTMALSGGKLYIAGFHSFSNNDAFFEVPDLTNVTKLVPASSSNNTMVIADGNLYVIGDNAQGQLGLGDDAPTKITALTRVTTLSNVTDAALGTTHSLVVAGGELYVAGSGNAIGLGGNVAKTFTKIPELKNVSAVSGMSDFSGVISDNRLYVAGSNSNGQLGMPIETKSVNRFTLVEKFATVDQAACGYTISAVISDNKLYVAGWNNVGQCGQPSSVSQLNAFTDTGLCDISSVALGLMYTVVLKSDGTLYGTGDCAYMGMNSDAKLYDFTKISLGYTIKYDMNGGDGSIADMEIEFGADGFTIPQTYPTKEDYHFVGWSTTKDGEKKYDAGQTVSVDWTILSIGDSTTLYAIWELYMYTIKYDMNGGNGTIEDMKIERGTTFTIPQTLPTKERYRFVGWATSKDSEKEYDAGQSIILDSTFANLGSPITLYAIWEFYLDLSPEITGTLNITYGTDIVLTLTHNDTFLDGNGQPYKYSYIWYKNDVKIPDSEMFGKSITLKLPTVFDSGAKYKVHIMAYNPGFTEIADMDSEEVSITVLPKQLSVVWGNTELAYNATPQAPTASVETGVTGVTCDLTVDGKQTNVGVNYQATASTANANFTLTNTTTTFKINKADITPVVTLDGWTYGRTANEPNVSGNTGSGAVTYEYSTDGKTFGTVIPTNAGTYYVRAKVAATENTSEATSTAATFTIVKADITPEVTLDGWTYGATANEPSVSGNIGNGAVTYEYSADGETYSTVIPINAGTYYVRATVAATGNTNKATSVAATFTIAKADITPVVTLDGWTYGATANEPSVSGNTGSGAATYEYSADGVTFGTGIHTNAGTYYVRATIAATDNYNGATSAAATFTVAKADTVINVDGVETEYTYNGTEQSVNSGAKHDRGDGTELTYTNNTFTTVAEGDGLVVTISIAESANYNAASATVTLKVHKAKVEAPVIAVKEYTGETLTAEVGDTELYTVAKNEGGKDNGLYDVELALTDPANYEWSAKEGATIAGATITLKFAVVKTANKWTGEPKIAGIKYGETLVPEYAAQHGNETVVIEYKAKGVDAYSTEKPTEVGEYVARFTIAANSNYDGLEAEVTFAIVKADLTITVTLEGWTYGATANDPIVNGNTGNGAVTYEYSTDGETYSTAKPTNAGTYYVRATIATTDNYNGATSEAVSFTIAKANYTNVAYNSELTGMYDPEKTLADYALDANYAWADATVIPTVAVTTYAAKYNADPDNYNDFDLIITLTISKADITVIVTLNGWTYGATANDASVNGNIDDGEVTYGYSADGETYSTAKPTNAGTYYVRASIAATDNYNGATSEAVSFTIKKADITPVVTLDGWTYGAAANDASVNGNTGNGEVAYGYSTDGGTYSTAKPTNAGTYYVRATIAATDNYNGATSEAVSFTIAKADVTPVVTLDGWTYGAAANDASVNGNTGNGEVTYGYSTDGETYSTAKPTNAGTYYVIAMVAATDNYNGATSKAVTFTIKKAVYDMSGVKFENKTVEANGNAQIITISGTLPDGVTVTYNGSGTEAGTYTITAKFVGDTANYEAIADMTATLTINAVVEKGGCGSVVTDGMTIAGISIAALLLACVIVMRKTRKEKK